ncbi:hypothetical protein J437_LFUL015480 [Ladona fulva]|uniref:ERAP1-like C-terminal domain-containing protein n=1 Tax=Ladona fulva TaxID=123851 RepID=A0A8K0P934_LADFU|nr:hypothetical protein J437_LFUL015480 [Ladona fulva]
MSFLDEMLTNSPIYDDFKELMLSISRKLVESVGWEDSNKESDHVKSLTRYYALRWSCQWGDENCIDEAKKRFSQWKEAYESNNEANYWIAPDLREVVYCNGIRYGSTSEWEFAWQRYLDSNVAKERDVLLDSLGCTREMPLLEKYLGMLLNSSSGISNLDGRIVFTTMTNNPLGSSLLFDSLKNKWDDIWKLKGSNLPELTDLIVSSTKYMTTPEQLAQLKQFWEDHQGHLGPMRKSFKRAIDKVQANVKWMERGYEEVKAWIESQK